MKHRLFLFYPENFQEGSVSTVLENNMALPPARRLVSRCVRLQIWCWTSSGFFMWSYIKACVLSEFHSKTHVHLVVFLSLQMCTLQIQKKIVFFTFFKIIILNSIKLCMLINNAETFCFKILVFKTKRFEKNNLLQSF